jgi:hypothetical protein
VPWSSVAVTVKVTGAPAGLVASATIEPGTCTTGAVVSGGVGSNGSRIATEIGY